MLNKRLAQNLKRFRSERNWTQEFSAELSGLSPRYWGKIERCEASATLTTLEKIALGFGVEVEDLITEVEMKSGNSH